MAEPLRFADYSVSDVTGFAVELDDNLPDYFRPWHDLASKAINLVASQTMREETKKMPLLDSSSLTSYKELRLAHLQLSVITSAFVWEDLAVPIQYLPACVAVPYCDVSDRLGTETCMSYSALMGNWARVDQHGSYTEDNLQVRYVLFGGQQFVDFNLKAVYTEIFFAQAFPAIKDVLEGSKRNCSVQATDGLRTLNTIVSGITDISKRYNSIMQPDVFFQQIVRGLTGFNEHSSYPEGILCEGVKDRPRRKAQNSAASQSTMFQLLDALLRIEYPQEKQDFFKRIRNSWPANFRHLYNVIVNWPGDVRAMAQTGSDENLKSAYNRLVDTIKNFRAYHIQLVTKYMIIPNRKLKPERTEDGPDVMAGIIPVLKEVRDVTLSQTL